MPKETELYECTECGTQGTVDELYSICYHEESGFPVMHAAVKVEEGEQDGA